MATVTDPWLHDVTLRYLVKFIILGHNDGCVCKCSFQQFCNWNEILIEMKFRELGPVLYVREIPILRDDAN